MTIARLITPQQLAKRLQEDNLVILDCRFSLDDPAYGQRSYACEHIPGAHFLDLEKDLSSPVLKGITGRHPLPDPDQLAAKLRQCGISHNTTVVLYDDGPGAFAARAWWLLAWLGKRAEVYLLNGGLQAWRAENLPLSDEGPGVSCGNFEGSADGSLLIDAHALQSRLGQADLTLLDARALPRFRGEVEPIDPVAGHIPGAQCAAFTDNLDARGSFRNPDELRQRFESYLDGRNPTTMVAYCGSGVTACHNLFALSLAGYELAPLYAGSWSEWITNPQRPIATGD